MTYVNGMVAAVPTENKEIYTKMALAMKPVFQRHGAIDVVDCWGVDVPDGETTSFPMAVKCKANETVVFSWITWPDKKIAEAGMEATMQDPAIGDLSQMPFDLTRMIFGGFEKLGE
ncbi:MAG: DUF1428 domain-containing protein [Sulfitobacter sp.]